MVKATELLRNKKHLIAVGLAASVLILYAVPIGQVTIAGNGNGNQYGPKGNGPPEFVPRGPNPNPGEPRGKPDGVPPDGSGTPPGQEQKQTLGTNNEKNKGTNSLDTQTNTDNKDNNKNTNTDNKNTNTDNKNTNTDNKNTNTDNKNTNTDNKNTNTDNKNSDNKDN